LVGAVSDRLSSGDQGDALLQAVVALGVIGFSTAGGLFWWARRAFVSAVADARRIDAHPA
jgi:uncharacterized iron-regulated membrane protein